MNTVRVIRYKTLLMQRLLDLVQRGYSHYVQGTIHKSKVTSLCEKFEKLYSLSDNARRRTYRKSKGQANAFFLIADIEKKGTLHWWLLVTEGEHPAHQLEKLCNAHDRGQRIRLTGYELVQLNRDKAKGGGIRWTWRMMDTTYDEWRTAIRSAVRAKNRKMEMQRLVTSLYQTPGFGQARIQVGNWQPD